MYLKRLLAFLCCFTLVFCLFPSSAFASGGNGNIDGGGGSMGQGTSSNFWNSGNDGVRITVVDASSGTAVSSPLDFSNRTQKTSLLHFGKVNKLQYLGGTGLSLQSGVAYSCIRPTQSMPTIVSSKGQSNIEAIKRYFCSEYACMMVAQAAGVDYERMIAGEYKLLIEPIAYFTHNGQYYCMTATEAGLYDQMSGGNLRKTMTSLTHKNLPLSMFLEFSDLGISAWTGSTTGKQNNSDIISTLGVGIVWFDEAPPEGEIEAPDVEYRVDTDVITAVTLRTDQDLTPDNPASVTFHILGTTYRVNDIVIPAGDSQVVWIKWHTPSTPQTVTITVSVSGAYTAQDTFVAKIVDLNEHIPPDPVATDTNPGYSVPPLPNETQKLTANWGVWSCYWVPVWVWCVVFCAIIFGLNVISTRFFAEGEFWFSLVKVVTIIAFIILGGAAIFGFIPMQDGSPAPGLSNITAEGWFPRGGLPILMTMVAVNFAFSGTELIGIAAGETENPRKVIPVAIRTTIARLIIFFIGTVFVLTWVLGENPVYQILSGGLMLGAIFMATDYVTSPVCKAGKVVFAIGCGLLTVLIRLYGSLPEGVSFAIVIMNILTPLIERVVRPIPFGKKWRRQHEA